ncbi:hypothetical protein RvY_00317 [Ramazzottius varieornatus]|uniref:Uncharacterized protein n=1 Tax=Ramazzottius varieornatus TaxID=947166 RepID=A0A1D1UIN8_RAMVA|nr:hypothetical protein RvY_00317 [Ramazzottius varieornatus]
MQLNTYVHKRRALATRQSSFSPAKPRTDDEKIEVGLTFLLVLGENYTCLSVFSSCLSRLLSQIVKCTSESGFRCNRLEGIVFCCALLISDISNSNLLSEIMYSAVVATGTDIHRKNWA